MVNSSTFLCHPSTHNFCFTSRYQGVNKGKNENQFHVIINSKETRLDDELILPPIFLIAPTEGEQIMYNLLNLFLPQEEKKPSICRRWENFHVSVNFVTT